MSGLIFNKLKSKKEDTEDYSESIFSSLKNKTSKSNKELKEIESIDETLSGLNLPDNFVAMPHYFSQTSIYAPRSGNRVEISERTNLWSQGDMNVSYSGPSLDTKIDIQLMSLVLKARDLKSNQDNIVKLKFKETMRSLGLNPHHPNSRTKFISSLNRHLEAKLFFSVGNDEAGFWRNFFVAEGTFFDYKNNILKIQISDIIPALFKLKNSGSFSIENMLISFAIKGSYASKLYSYYESNDVPFPIKISTILEICDKKIENGKKPNNNQRKVVKEALEELESLSFLDSWYFDTSKDSRDPLVVINKKKKKDRTFSKDIEFKTNYIEND